VRLAENRKRAYGSGLGGHTEFVLSILLADDNAFARESLAHAFNEAGHEATVATDGEEAWHAFRANVFDLVVWQMPRLDGVSLARRIRESGSHAPIVIETSDPVGAAEALGATGPSIRVASFADLLEQTGSLG
jgi:CheY-like chemotaxis protein